MADDDRSEMGQKETKDPEMGSDDQSRDGDGGSDEKDAAELQAELERTRQALSKANSEAAERRKKLEAYEEAERKRKEAEMSEKEKLEAKLAEAQAQAEQATQAANERLLRASVTAEAAKLDFADPADAWSMVDRDGLAIDDEGEAQGVAEAVKALVKAKPYLVKRKESHDLNGDNGRGRGQQQGDEDNKARELSLRQRFGI